MAETPTPKSAMQLGMERMLRSVVGEENFERMAACADDVQKRVQSIDENLKKILLNQENMSDRLGRIEVATGIPPVVDHTDPLQRKQ